MDNINIKRTFSRIGMGILLLYAVQLIISIAISTILTVTDSALLENIWFTQIIPMLLGYVIGIPLLLLVLRKVPNVSTQSTEKKNIPVATMMLLFLGGFGVTFYIDYIFTILSNLISEALGFEMGNILANLAADNDVWAVFVLIVVIAPFVEEFIFRGILYKKLMPYGGKVYVSVSALIFALFHANIYQLFYAFVLGLIFGYMTYYSGTTKYSMILHFLVNLFGSGIGTLITAYAHDEHTVMLYGSLLMLFASVGLIAGLTTYFRKKKTLTYAPAEIPASNKLIFGNAGMIVYITIFSILSFIIPLFSAA